jgi:hypothetical protein
MTLVRPDAFADAIAYATDADDHAAQVQAYADAGIDEVYVQQTGPDTVSSQLARKTCFPASQVTPCRTSYLSRRDDRGTTRREDHFHQRGRPQIVGLKPRFRGI